MYTRTISREIKKLCLCQQRKTKKSPTNRNISFTLYAFPKPGPLGNSCKNDSSSISTDKPDQYHERDLNQGDCAENVNVVQQEYVPSQNVCELTSSDSSCCTIKHIKMTRKLTPPYIAQGKGLKESFDEYYLM